MSTSSTAAQSYSYVYDRFGNRWQQNVTGGTGLQSTLSFMGGLGGPTNKADTYSYDAAGNLLNDGVNSYLYDDENRIVQVSGSSGVTIYIYDAMGRRVEKTSATETVDFVNDLAGKKITELNPPGVMQRGEVFAGGRHIATYWNSTTYFDHADWLGSERARSTYQGALAETCASLPFGDGLICSNSDPSPLHFTGKERDSESGLDNFGARYDASSMGRFMTPDPLGGHQEDPQTLNKYSYVRNNPLSLTDPTGLDFNLTCSGPDTATCHGGLQGTTTTTTDANGNQTSTFTATVISNDKNGNLVDQNKNQYSATVDASGVHFTENGSDTSSTGTWVNDSPETKFTQTTGTLAGFSFDFSQPGKGQSFSGTFSTDTNFYGAKSALEKAGFSVSYLDQCCNLYEMVHNWSLVNFRSPGDPNTGQNSVHFLVNPGDKVGLVVPTTGKLHGYETNPNVSPLEHLRNDMPW